MPLCTNILIYLSFILIPTFNPGFYGQFDTEFP